MGTKKIHVNPRLWAKKRNLQHCPRFFLFWIYQMHLHNLDIEGLAAVMPNPHVEFRSKHITIHPVDFAKLKMKCSAASDLEEVTGELGNLALSPHKCPLCTMSFPEETSLKTHVSTFHPETHSANPRECKECGKILGNAQSLSRHILTVHRTCKTCKVVFQSSDDLQQHMDQKTHTTCNVCGKDWGFPSKLKEHMKSHKPAS